MISARVSVILASVALLCLGCGGGKKVSMLEQQVSMLEQKSDTLEVQLAKMKTERDAFSLDKTLQKAELDIVRKDLNKLRAANDSLQALVASPSSPEKAASEPPMKEPSIAVQTESTKPAVVAPPPPEDLPVIGPGADFQRSYDQALALFKQKKYSQSEQSFAALLESNRNHRLSGNCQYWIGECLYAQNKFGEALAEFQKVFAYPRSYKADAAQFKVALCFVQMGKQEEAKAEFNRLISAYPNSEFVGRAKAQLEKLP